MATTGGEMKKHHRDLLARAADIAGIDRVELIQTGRHPALKGSANGRPFKVTIACTPSNADYAVRNALRDLRRIVDAAI